MKRRTTAALGGAVCLACSGAGVGQPADRAPVEPEGGAHAEVSEEGDEASDPLPGLEPDHAPRPDFCLPTTYETSTPMLAREQPAGGTVQVIATKNRIVEVVVMRSGRMVRVTRGGCTHATETWELSPAPDGPLPQVFDELMSQLELAEDQPTGASRCLKHMPDPTTNGWHAGEAYCSYTREGQVLTLTYDFPI